LPNAIGIDVGGTNLRLGVFAGNDLLLETRHQADFSTIFKTQPADIAWQQILQIISKGIASAFLQYPEINSIGIGFPGFIDHNTNVISQSPNLPGLNNVNLAQDLSLLIGKKVIVANDANAAAYGEYCLAGKPGGGLIYLGLGTGVGGGLILNGKLHNGEHGCAMEVGHIIVTPQGRKCGCGNLGCMETYASATGVSLSYFEATGEKKSAAEIAVLADAGDKQAVFAYEAAANALAQALASMLKVVDVKNVVLGGGMSHAWHLIQNAFYSRLNADLIPVLRNKVNVKISTANDTAGMLGAAMLGYEV
jgi:glucokinase